MQTVGTLEAEWWQVLRGSVSAGAKEDESSAGRWITLFYCPFLVSMCFET
jgi:hypothetical protein